MSVIIRETLMNEGDEIRDAACRGLETQGNSRLTVEEARDSAQKLASILSGAAKRRSRKMRLLSAPLPDPRIPFAERRSTCFHNRTLPQRRLLKKLSAEGEGAGGRSEGAIVSKRR